MNSLSGTIYDVIYRFLPSYFDMKVSSGKIIPSVADTSFFPAKKVKTAVEIESKVRKNEKAKNGGESKW